MSNFRSAAAYFRNHLPSLRAPVFCPQMGNSVGMSGAGHGPLLGNDLQANLPEAKRTSGRNTPRMLRTADGAHAGFKCGFSQSWPPRLQILKVPLAQPCRPAAPSPSGEARVWHRGKDRVACRQGCVSGCWVARNLAPRAIHCIMPPPQP